MAMITTCPACRTRFKVTPEQLAAHDGDARCGRCAKIFLAHNYLEHEQEPGAAEAEKPVAAQAEIIAEVAPQPAEETPPQVEEAQEFSPPAAPPASETAPPPEEEEAFPPPEDAPATPPPVEPQVGISATEEPEPETSNETIAPAPIESAEAEEPAPVVPQDEESAIEQPEPELENSDEAIAEASPEEIPAVELRRVLPEPAQEERLDLILPDWEDHEKTPDEAPTAEMPTAAEEKPARKKRGLFWLWLLGSILLLAALGGQGLYFFRTDLAARHPDFKPFLLAFCDVLRCEIRLPADPDFLSIEASSLEADPVQANLVTLNAILRNRAKLVQEYPQLELTLTDTHDQMVARRILSPKEYAKNADLGRGMPPNEDLTVKLPLDLGDLKAAGYRVFLFYPK